MIFFSSNLVTSSLFCASPPPTFFYDCFTSVLDFMYMWPTHVNLPFLVSPPPPYSCMLSLLYNCPRYFVPYVHIPFLACSPIYFMVPLIFKHETPPPPTIQLFVNRQIKRQIKRQINKDRQIEDICCQLYIYIQIENDR